MTTLEDFRKAAEHQFGITEGLGKTVRPEARTDARQREVFNAFGCTAKGLFVLLTGRPVEKEGDTA